MALALGGVPGVHVAEFVAQQGGELGLVLHVGQDTACHAHGASGKGVGVDVIGVEHPVRVRHVGAVAELVHALAQLTDIAVQPSVLYRAKVL